MVETVPERVATLKNDTNEHPVPQNIGKMQVVGSKQCKRAQRGCNLSKRQRRRGGPPVDHPSGLVEDRSAFISESENL